MAEHLDAAELAYIDASPAPSPRLIKRDPGRMNLSSKTKTNHLGQLILPGNLRYNMSHPRRGVALIFNNKTFKKSTGMSERTGTDVDAAKLMGLFRSLGFETHLLSNLTCMEMVMEVQRVARYDHSDADCFAMALLSHGDEDGVYGSDGVIPLSRLCDPLKGSLCPGLTGKPKLFFIQACRGMDFDKGVEILDDEDQVDAMKSKSKIFIPHEADVMIACSTVPGYYSWRNRMAGSWFVQAICDVFGKWGKTLELMQLLTRVNHQVAYQFESSSTTEALSGKKQIPDIATRLTKELYFTPKSGRV